MGVVSGVLNDCLPTRNLLRQGSFKAFHLYQAVRRGVTGAVDIMNAYCDVGRLTGDSRSSLAGLHGSVTT
jgi:hypothetical protein